MPTQSPGEPAPWPTIPQDRRDTCTDLLDLQVGCCKVDLSHKGDVKPHLAMIFHDHFTHN